MTDSITTELERSRKALAEEATKRVSNIILVTKISRERAKQLDEEGLSKFVGFLAQSAALAMTDESLGELLEALKASTVKSKRATGATVLIAQFVNDAISNDPDFDENVIVDMVKARFPHIQPLTLYDATVEAFDDFWINATDCVICDKTISRADMSTHFYHEDDCGYDVGGCLCDNPCCEGCCPDCN